jgi:hypothetical protein
MASRHPSPSRTAWRRSCGERLQSNDSVTTVAPGPSEESSYPHRYRAGRRWLPALPQKLPPAPAPTPAGGRPRTRPPRCASGSRRTQRGACSSRNASPARDSPAAGAGSRTMPEPSISGWFAESASSPNSCSADASMRRETDTNPCHRHAPSCRPQYLCVQTVRAARNHRTQVPRCCGGVRVAAKTMASSDLGGPRPGGMTVPDRPAGICPDRLPHIAGAGRWPPPDPACVIRCGLLPVPGPERVEARRSGDPILRWPRRRGADAAGRCMTGQWRAGPGSHRKRSARAVSALPGSSGPGPARSARSGAR